MKILLFVSKTKGNIGCADFIIIEDIIDGEKSILKVIKKFFCQKEKPCIIYCECVCECESVLVPESRIF